MAENASQAPLTQAELKELYVSVSDTFKDSNQYLEVKYFFEESILPLQKLNINQAICYGLGRLSSPDETEVNYNKNKNFMSQFFAFTWWIDLLRKKFEFTNGIWFQDPDFTEEDMVFIESHGYKCIHPENEDNADSKVTPETFVFAPVDGWKDIIHSCIRRNHPALTISHSIESRSPHMGPYRKWALTCGRDDPETGMFRWSGSLDLIPNPEHRDNAIEDRRWLHHFYSTHLFRPLWIENSFSNNF